MPLMTVEELERFLAAEFPQGFNPQSGLAIEAVWTNGCRVRQRFSVSSLRPGGTISGPTMMGLADFAMYVAVLAAIGPAALAVTINLSINFLRKPG
jgi:acyl-coenzyme A thioesterase PaaI-like protein